VVEETWSPIVFPAYQLLVVEEQLREQEAEGVRMPEGMEQDELALRILVAAEMARPNLEH
jgi:hypothetical protein